MKYRLLIFFNLLVVSCFSISFKNLLGTEQYVVVGINDCTISTETAIKDDVCAAHMRDFTRVCSYKDKTFSLLYLPAEPQTLEPPKVLIIFQVDKSIAYKLQHIEFKNFSIHKEAINFNSHIYFMKPSGNPIDFNRIFGVVYDHKQSLLYIFNTVEQNGKEGAFVDVFFMYPNERDKVVNKHLYTIPIKNTFLGTEWSSDPYSNTFYYHKIIHDQKQVSILYSIPANRLLLHLQNDNHGKLEKSFGISDQTISFRDSIQVTNGLIYSYINPMSDGGKGYRFIRSLSLSNGSRCHFNNFRNNDFMFVITGWEYCKLRDGLFANYKSCMEKPKIEHQKGESETTASNMQFLWIITMVAIANALLLLVILCLVCRRNEPDAIPENSPFIHSHSRPRRNILKTPDQVFEKRRLNSTVTSYY